MERACRGPHWWDGYSERGDLPTTTNDRVVTPLGRIGDPQMINLVDLGVALQSESGDGLGAIQDHASPIDGDQPRRREAQCRKPYPAHPRN